MMHIYIQYICIWVIYFSGYAVSHEETATTDII